MDSHRRQSSTRLPVTRPAPPSRPAVIEILTVLVIGASLVHQLLLPPIVGLADNGDYLRVMGWLGLDYLPSDQTARSFGHVQQWYSTAGPFRPSAAVSSELLLAGLARVVGLALSPPGLFDLRAAGLVHGLALLGAVWLIMRSTRAVGPVTRLTLAICLTLVVTDVSTVAYLNSLYAEPAGLLCLLATVGLLLHLSQRSTPGRWLLVALALVAAGLVTAKHQNSLLALPLAGLLVTASWSQRRRLGLLLATGLLLLGIGFGLQTPAFIVRANLFNVIFYDLLKHSPDVAGDIADLGLDDGVAAWVGETAFTPRAAEQRAVIERLVYDRLSYPTLVRFLARHPERLAAALGRTAETLPELRPDWLGTYTAASGRPALALRTDWSLWSTLVEQGLPRSPWLPLVWLGLLLLVGVDQARAGGWAARWGPVGVTLVAAMAGLQIVVAGVLGGELELAKHLFLSQQLLTAGLVIVVVWVTHRIEQWRSHAVASPELAAGHHAPWASSDRVAQEEG